MKTSFKIWILHFSCVALLTCSCRHDKNKSDEIFLGKNRLLFNSISIIQDETGAFDFTDDLEVVRDQVSYIFTKRNAIFKSVADFGFDFTELGTQYFFVTQHSMEGTQTFFIFLNNESEIILPRDPGGGSTHGWTCSNMNCCERCVPHDTLICPCHITEESCIINQQVPKCKQEFTYIQF